MKSSDGLFVIVLVGLALVGVFLYTRKGGTLFGPPPPSACDQLLATGASAYATSQGVPTKINAPTGLCASLEALAKAGYRIGGATYSNFSSIGRGPSEEEQQANFNRFLAEHPGLAPPGTAHDAWR